MIFNKLRKVILRHFMALRRHSLLVALLVYIALSWCLLRLSGEHALVGSDFVYWLVVSTSTVGYGDLSPSTEAGKWVTALVIIPLGLSIFAITVGRLAGFASYHWRKGVRGLGSVNRQNHIVLVGWNGQRTLRLPQLLIKEEEQAGTLRPIVLCVRVEREIENPMPEAIQFVKVSSFNDKDEMDRASIATAACIVIDNDSDDATMTAALFCHARNSAAHIIVYFADESLSDLLTIHCPSIECTPSVSVEMLAKATADPGSSALHYQLLSVDQGMTQYSICYPETMPDVRFEILFSQLKKHYEATVIAISSRDVGIVVNPALEVMVLPGETLYYIASDRISVPDWGLLNT
ncbi:MAG: potassium channel protein [Spongiibacteraceae bacterium]|nr:potassium channel protein [Spongiibacteraceae bacterium]